jgi:hypothetical protein
VCLQEVKLSTEKLTKELVCVDGFEVGAVRRQGRLALKHPGWLLGTSQKHSSVSQCL